MAQPGRVHQGTGGCARGAQRVLQWLVPCSGCHPMNAGANTRHARLTTILEASPVFGQLYHFARKLIDATGASVAATACPAVSAQEVGARAGLRPAQVRGAVAAQGLRPAGAVCVRLPGAAAASLCCRRLAPPRPVPPVPGTCSPTVQTASPCALNTSITMAGGCGLQYRQARRSWAVEQAGTRGQPLPGSNHAVTDGGRRTPDDSATPAIDFGSPRAAASGTERMATRTGSLPRMCGIVYCVARRRAVGAAAARQLVPAPCPVTPRLLPGHAREGALSAPAPRLSTDCANGSSLSAEKPPPPPPSLVQGLMRKRVASINEAPIREEERRIAMPAGGEAAYNTWLADQARARAPRDGRRVPQGWRPLPTFCSGSAARG